MIRFKKPENSLVRLRDQVVAILQSSAELEVFFKIIREIPQIEIKPIAKSVVSDYVRYDALSSKKDEAKRFEVVQHLRARAYPHAEQICKLSRPADILTQFKLLEEYNYLRVIPEKMVELRSCPLDPYRYVRHFDEFVVTVLYLEGRLTKDELYRSIIALRVNRVSGSGQQEMILRFEMDNNHLWDEIVFDGYHFSTSHRMITDKLVKRSTKPSEDITDTRQFDSEATKEFSFNFDNTLTDWDNQTLTFANWRYFFKKTNSLQEAYSWSALRGKPQNTEDWIATAVYANLLKRRSAKTYDYLLECGFKAKSTDVWNYIKECKRFTSHLKYNYSFLKGQGIHAEMLFEMEQLSGFRADKRDLDWEENIGGWIEEKHNMNTPMAAYIAKVQLNSITKANAVDNETDRRTIYDSAIYNSSGSAKGESISFESLKAQGLKVPKKIPASKTSYNLSINWEQRLKHMADTAPLYGYPIQKKEVAKVRYIVNTDIKSHYKFAPLERLIARLIAGTEVFNIASADEQAEIQKVWTTSKTERRLAMDQSNFDNYCSAHSFIHTLQHYLDTVKDYCPELTKLLFETIENFKLRRIFVLDGANLSRWSSGMLSGWKFTSVGDSLINLQQTAYCANLAGYSKSEYKITVLGDDVAMTTNSVSASKLAYAMNAIGLIQHPDKTINSDRFVEFLRTLYDNEGVIQGYPTRLIPSLVYLKPWLSSFEADEMDFGGQVARIKNWRALGNRMSQEGLTADAATTDFLGGKRRDKLGLNFEQVRAAINSPRFVIEMKAGWTKVTKKKQILDKAPKILRPLEANLLPKDLERWAYIARDETFFGDIESIISLKTAETIPWFKIEQAKLDTIPNLPFSKVWLRKLRKKMGFREFAKLSIIWGRPMWKADLDTREKLNLIFGNVPYYLRIYDTAQRLKADFIPVLNFPDSLTAPLRNNMFAKSIRDSSDLEEAKAAYTHALISVNWGDYLLHRVGTDKTYT